MTGIPNCGIRDERYKALFIFQQSYTFENALTNSQVYYGQLFDMINDPKEINNLWEKHPDIVNDLLAKYSQNFTGKYQRYQSAISYEQPVGAFAIGANSFKTKNVTNIHGPQNNPAQFFDDTSYIKRWIKANHWASYWLLATPGTQTLTIEFAIPNGGYRVEVKMRGKASFVLDGREKQDICLKNMGSKNNLSTQKAELGPVNIHDAIFRATIIPDTSEEMLLIRSFGFTPLESQKNRDMKEEKRRLDQLKSLGYIN